MAIYIFDAGFFRSRVGAREADLPQPVDGAARCKIRPLHAGMEPILYRSRDDLEHVVRAEFEAIGATHLPVGDYVEYYTRTKDDYVGVVSELKKSINEASARGAGLDRMFGEAA